MIEAKPATSASYHALGAFLTRKVFSLFLYDTGQRIVPGPHPPKGMGRITQTLTPSLPPGTTGFFAVRPLIMTTGFLTAEAVLIAAGLFLLGVYLGGRWR